MTLADYLALFSMVSIWMLLGINITLAVGGAIYYYRMAGTDVHIPMETYPFVSVMVPAHNESVVLKRTVESILRFDYPKDRYEVIVINDNSTDNTAQVLADLQKKYADRFLIVVNTDPTVGGKGKSNALNIGYSVAR